MLDIQVKGIDKIILKDYSKVLAKKIKYVHQKLYDDSIKDENFKGWLSFATNYDKNELKKIEEASEKIKLNSDIFIVIGIGGSYLGARAGIEFLHSSNYNFIRKNTPDIFFAGNSMSSFEISKLIKICENKDVSLNIISKSGTTTEPAITFRIFKEFMEKKYGAEEAKERIYCTTDRHDGVLKQMATSEGYECFDIPKDIGGRYSVLTPVGLLPLAVSGANIREILNGAADAEKELKEPTIDNPCYRYAVYRNMFYNNGKSVEIITGYEPRLRMFFEWWKQLFGESEGKDGKGIFPASAIFTMDLHSLGQFIQEGSKILFETVLMIENNFDKIILQEDSKNLDGLNYLVGKSLDYISKRAFEATLSAHVQGEVPNIVITVPDAKEYDLGYLIYFFEKACAVSGYILGVNPFNQPGVERYKKNMFKLLDKPGY